MRKAHHWKHIFCLEGLWSANLRQKSSVQPVLELLSKQYNMKYIYKDCATEGEFLFYLSKWPQKRYSDHPILYLAFHGDEQQIKLSDGTNIVLNDIASQLENQCKNRIIIFGSCNTLDIDKRHIKSFIKKTGALAVCGYKTEVDWVKSTAFELLLISAMQENEFSKRGIASIVTNLNSLSKTFNDLKFRIVTSKEIY